MSRRADPTYDEPAEGLPDHLFAPAWTWAENVLRAGRRSPSHELLETVQLALRLNPPLRWTDGVYSARDSLRASMFADREIALDVLDLLLHVDNGRDSVRLNTMLRMGGSVWTVGHRDNGGKQLERRAPAPVAAAIDAIQSESDRAHHCLRIAWGAVMGRNPDPSTAYRESVRAVETACRPVVSPENAKATLGSMIGDVTAKPDKWRVALDSATPLQIVSMMELIWRGQRDRHGTDNPEVPLNVSHAEADSAFYVALALVRLFTSGAIARA